MGGPIDLNDAALLAGRAALSAMFFLSAIDKFRLDPQEVKMIASLHLPAPRTLERATGVFEVLAGAALVSGFQGRIAALALAAFTLFVALAFLRFWSFKGPPEAKIGMRNVFFADIAVAGGLICLAASGMGRLSL